MTVATIELDGRTVAYRQAGGGNAPALLLVHGWTGGSDDFTGVLPALAEDRRVVALDLPGHGGSQGTDRPEDYTVDRVAGWVLRAADALDLGECHLLGHSLGGLVVQRVAAAASQRLASLVLMDTGLGALPSSRAEQVVRIALAARDEGPLAALSVSVGGDLGALPDEERAVLEARFAAMQPAAIVGGGRSLLGTAPVGAFLRGIDIPVLVIHGEDDGEWGPPEQRLLVATVRGAEHVVVPGAAHSPQRENPHVWTSAVRGFLRRVDAR
jgi:pimeloyl-ACP methyl ester carboxylesterase